MEYLWLLFIFLYLPLTHVLAKYLGAKRKIGYFNTVKLSILLSPFIAFFIVIAFPLTDQSIE